MAIELASLLKKIKIQADWVGLRHVKEVTTVRSARDGKPDDNMVDWDEGIMVEVMVDGQFAYAASDAIEPAAIQRAHDQAVKWARWSSRYSVAKFDETVRPRANGTYRSPFEQKFDALTAGEILDRLVEVSLKIRTSEQVQSAVARAFLVENQTSFSSTNGSEFYQEFLLNDVMLYATAQKDDSFQTRTWGNGSKQSGLECLDRELLLLQAERIGREAVALTEAPECPSDSRDLILAPDQLYLQIHESIGHPLEIDRIIGDERNYAGWSFIKKEDFGNLQYGSKHLNVTFDPTVAGEFASYDFDDTGVQATKQYIIKDGLLVRGLGSLESQKRSGLPGVANARATSWNRPPIDRMANLNLEPGENSLQDMISGIEKGILMRTNRSWSIDDYRNKFQFGCEFGQLIENGELTKVVKNPNYRGISTPFWKSLKKVGDQSTFEVWGSPYCGKGEPNQVIRVGHATPMCLFENVEVFGGAS